MSDKKIKLENINDTDFKQYISYSIKNYAEEKVKAGNWNKEEAILLAKNEFNTLLPDGMDTKGHSIFSISDLYKKKRVGVLWVEWNNLNMKSAYIWDILIFDEFRRMGYGMRAMNELMCLAKEHGAKSITLHVFAHNESAILFYKKLGFYSTNIIMKKDL
ncbi:MAG: GNAT family N-acetyltransferase [Candidatus Thermoplasmatota archaeon]|jgi:ribosomal protein S18 acetylase RimI-like enzyme|nr:GNAT family N-acetyltransferase [Candidatus Thermoplasmatota archaeon]MCL5963671.1 GNAT family N-acetyltransferase [Candidatus Thermoplasmatota archaeon]